ncbi:MAG: ribulokinase [Clostridia bacterium]|nr:ribulokinase [Clostridia bacterium]
MRKYSLGIDFGTLSARAILVDIHSGEEVATSVCDYPHGVMTETFIDGSALPSDYALQHPGDYLDCMFFVIKDCIEKASVDPYDITGVGVDFTASTVLPVLEDGTPLCFTEKFKNTPHAYVKLWKHHAAQKEADEINALAKKTDAQWLRRYGGTISSEWLFPKVLEIRKEAPEVYSETFRFIEAGDWIVWMLTGKETHSICTTGFKAIWDEENGYPDKAFLKALHPDFENIVGTKISEDVIKLSQIAGYITKEAEEKTGLKAGTPVHPAFIDAHAALPALGITHSGELLMIIGTSTCHILLGDKKSYIPGISGFVKDGIAENLYAFEAGQACVGDSFDWFIKNCVPASYTEKAGAEGINIHKYLRKKAALLPPGSNGILALDWFNGNRTPYVSGTLSGLILGLNITTSPEEIYRALIESTAYGTKRIVDIYEKSGIKINKIFAAGGIAEKDELLMQIYADVLGKEIFLSGTGQACAFGSAVLGAVNQNGYASLTKAAEKMKKIKAVSYKPNPENTGIYEKLYKEYETLSEFFANSDNKTMEILKNGGK